MKPTVIFTKSEEIIQIVITDGTADIIIKSKIMVTIEDTIEELRNNLNKCTQSLDKEKK